MGGEGMHEERGTSTWDTGRANTACVGDCTQAASVPGVVGHSSGGPKTCSLARSIEEFGLWRGNES